MRSPVALVAGLVLALAPALANAQQSESPLAKIQWASGPVIGRLGDVAQVSVPATCRFTDAHGSPFCPRCGTEFESTMSSCSDCVDVSLQIGSVITD